MTDNSTSIGLGSRPDAGVSALKGHTGAEAPAETRGKTTIADSVVAKIAGVAAASTGHPQPRGEHGPRHRRDA